MARNEWVTKARINITIGKKTTAKEVDCRAMTIEDWNEELEEVRRRS